MRPRTCPTTARAGAPLRPQSPRVPGSSVLGSCAKPRAGAERTPTGSCHLRPGLAPPAGWAGRGWTFVPGWRQNPPGGREGGEEGVGEGWGAGAAAAPTAARPPSPRGSPAPPRPDPGLRACPPARGRRRGCGVEPPAASAAPTHRPRSAPALRDAPRKVTGMLPAPLVPPAGGGHEPARGSLGDVVLGPLHLHLRPLSISRLVWSFVFPNFLSPSRSHLCSRLNKCWSAPVDPWSPSPYEISGSHSVALGPIDSVSSGSWVEMQILLAMQAIPFSLY